MDKSVFMKSRLAVLGWGGQFPRFILGLRLQCPCLYFEYDMQHPIIQRYQRFAESYDQYDFIPKEMARRLWGHVEMCRLSPSWALDLGVGPKTLVPTNFPEAKVVALDACQAMASMHVGYGVCADAHHLPLASQSMDLVIANAHLHWVDDPKQCLSEVSRVLRPEGVFFFSTLGPDTLKEARAVWTLMGQPHQINAMRDLHDWGDDLKAFGFRDPVLDRQILTVTFPSPKALLRCLQRSGSGVQSPRPGLMTPSILAEFCEGYEAYRTPDGLVEATFEIIIGQGWGQRVQEVTPKRMVFKPSDSAASLSDGAENT